MKFQNKFYNVLNNITLSSQKLYEDTIQELDVQYMECENFPAREAGTRLELFSKWLECENNGNHFDSNEPNHIYDLNIASEKIDYVLKTLDITDDSDMWVRDDVKQLKENIDFLRWCFSHQDNQKENNLNISQNSNELNDTKILTINNPIGILFAVRNNIISANQYLQELNNSKSNELIQLLDDSVQELNLLQRWFMRNEKNLDI